MNKMRDEHTLFKKKSHLCHSLQHAIPEHLQRVCCIDDFDRLMIINKQHWHQTMQENIPQLFTKLFCYDTYTLSCQDFSNL